MEKRSSLFNVTEDRVRFLVTALLLTLLLAACVALLVLWRFYPEHPLLPASAAVLGVWFAEGCAALCVHLYRRMFLPLERLEKFADRLACGETPEPPQDYSQRRGVAANLSRSLHLIRDRLRDADAVLRRSSRHGGQSCTGECDGDLCGRILTSMLPDIRTPLNNLAGYCHLLRTRPDSPERGAWLDAIARNRHAMEQFLERLLDVGSLGMPVDRNRVQAAFDLTSLIRRLTDYNAQYLLERGVALIKRFSSGAPEKIMCDRDVLFQLLSIMIRVTANAAAPGNSVEISCGGRQHGGVMFGIAETGPVPHENPSAGRFDEYRRNRRIESQPDRTVLGLLFVEDKAAAVNGRLEVHDGEAPELRLILENAAAPRRGASETGASMFVDAPPHRPERRRGSEPHGARSVLVLDDGGDFADVLRTSLPGVNVDRMMPPGRLKEYPRPEAYDAVVVSLETSNVHVRTQELKDFLAAASASRTAVFILVNDNPDRYRQHLSAFPDIQVIRRPVDFAELLRNIGNIAGASRPDATS